MAFKYDVFLSHNSNDKSIVKKIAKILEDKYDLKVFLDVWNLVPGDPWQEDIEIALSESRTVAVFLGPSGIGGWHNEEMRVALSQRVKDSDRRVIPVLLPKTKKPKKEEMPAFLGRMSWVDFTNGITDKLMDRFVSGIRGRAPGRS
jgi:hypothetical protein